MKNWKRSGKFVKHHIKNRVAGGKGSPSNLLKFDSERERAWHFLFHKFREVAELLLRTCEIKGQRD